jgi:hypothetical protein
MTAFGGEADIARTSENVCRGGSTGRRNTFLLEEEVCDGGARIWSARSESHELKVATLRRRRPVRQTDSANSDCPSRQARNAASEM